MRRAELTEGIAQVQNALESSALQHRLSTLFFQDVDPNDPAFQEKLLTALKTYAVRAERFETPARRLAEAAELDELAQPSAWVRLLKATDRRYVRLLHERIRFIHEYLPAVMPLLEPEPPTGEGALPMDENHRLTVVLVEQDGWPCTPRRARKALESVEDLYDLCATITGVQPDPLVMAGCDSGRDKAFYFLGTPRVVDDLRQVLLTVWDRVVFFRSQPPAERTRQAIASLPLLKRVERLSSDGTLSREQGELLRRSLRDSVTAFLEAGAIIPELEEHARFDPRVLMGPEPRLLTERPGRRDAPVPPEPPPTPGESAEDEEANAASVKPTEEAPHKDEKPWRITDEFDPREPEEPADPEAPAESPTNEAAAERPSFENRVAYLLDELKRPQSSQRDNTGRTD